MGSRLSGIALGKMRGVMEMDIDKIFKEEKERTKIGEMINHINTAGGMNCDREVGQNPLAVALNVSPATRLSCVLSFLPFNHVEALTPV